MILTDMQLETQKERSMREGAEESEEYFNR